MMARLIAKVFDRSLGRTLLLVAPVVVVLLLLPSFINIYQTQLFTYGLIFAIAALGFNLLLGSTGLLSFGHSAYFGLGAYSAAFMVRYLGVSSMELYILGGILMTGAISAIFGYICVRHTRIFFAVLTLALSQVLWTLAYKFFWVTGGTDGIRVPFSNLTLLGGLIDFSGRGAYPSFVQAYYYYVLFLFVCCVVLMWVIVHSPFGKALQAIRDNEVRARFLGVRIIRYRWLAFLVSGCFTGLAGILWVPLNGLVTPDILYWPFSGEIVFMTLLGGFRNFTGPIVGAVVFTYLKAYAIATTQYWQFLLGFVLLVLVMALPIGLVGAASRLVAFFRKRWGGPAAQLVAEDQQPRGGAQV
ncbi:MAG: branched-chain amino acid ABC transporter permease [Kiloniellales bacterium]